jgi:hypothetical protein
MGKSKPSLTICDITNKPPYGISATGHFIVPIDIKTNSNAVETSVKKEVNLNDWW